MFSVKSGSSLYKISNPLFVCSRSYRFGQGQRATPTGYHVHPKWFDQKLLEQSKPIGIFNQDAKNKLQNRFFDEEALRQTSLINRMEKIEVILEKPFPKGEDYTLIMNAGISTPDDCAKHISEMLSQRSALAVVDGEHYWHMHQPLAKSSHLRLLHFQHETVMPVNEAFWRSCSMILASVVSRAFKEEHSVEIISPLMSDVRSGSFICDLKISSLSGWEPTHDERRILTSLLWEEVNKNLNFERLKVSKEFAYKLFNDSKPHIERLDKLNNDEIVVYRVGDYIEMSQLPLISRTSQIGSIFLSAIHPVETSSGKFYRFQGIAMPSQLHINAFVFSIIRERSAKLNRFGLD